VRLGVGMGWCEPCDKISVTQFSQPLPASLMISARNVNFSLPGGNNDQQRNGQLETFLVLRH
jgi:hypothetical protein